jgi:hypothetical protein
LIGLLLLPLLLVGIPPLSAGQEARLETARDGTDHREEAFLALAEHVRAWSGATGDAPIRLVPDYAAMTAEPARYRGDLCRVTGIVQQRALLGAPYDVAEEWFLRTEDGRPVLVYVVDRGDLPEAAARPGRMVSVDARFYKRATFAARDGVRRDYPAFVGTRPRAVGRGDAGVGRLWIVGVPVGVLLVAFVALLVFTRRRRGEPAGRGRRPQVPVGDAPGPPLPEDPGEALAELRRRARS